MVQEFEFMSSVFQILKTCNEIQKAKSFLRT